MDKMHVNRLKVIDSVAASSRVLECIEGCKLLEYDKVIDLDYQPCVIDVALEDCFNETLDN